MSDLKSLKYYIEASRPVLVIGAVFYLFIGILFANFSLLSWSTLLSILTGIAVTASVYSFNYWTDIVEDIINLPKSAIVNSKITSRKVLFFSSLCATLSLFFAYFLSFYSMVVVITILVIGILYSYPILGKRHRIKNMPFLKSVIIAFGWSLGVLIPVFAVTSNISTALLTLSIFIFLQVIAGTVIRDIKDLSGDIKAGIRTIPVMLGVKKTGDLLFLINTVSLAFLISSSLIFNAPRYLLFMTIGCAWRYWNLMLLYRDYQGRTVPRFVYEHMNLGTGGIFALTALIGKLLVPNGF